ncbi:hypothetical protein GW17_00007331 [Ensete ventricosum]|nr:hypothetical protein GW17_00007331 [Ensete ventricosum]
MSRLSHIDPTSFARLDLGVSSDAPVTDQLSPLSTGGVAEPTCQTNPLPDPRQPATSGDVAPFAKEAARRKERSYHVIEPTEAI